MRMLFFYIILVTLFYDVDFDDICPRLFYLLSCFFPFLLSMHDVCMPYALPFVSMTLPLFVR
jgi:hypothetical protein